MAPNNGRGMIRYYPSGVTEIGQLSKEQRRLLIGRHSACQGSPQRTYTAKERRSRDIHTPEPLCECTGYRPPNSVKVKLLDNSSGSDDTLWGWNICKCGHELDSHGVAEVDEDGSGEFIRKAKVALRIDELLGDQHKLLDFDYSDEDTTSLMR
jgi:hypothetical protein